MTPEAVLLSAQGAVLHRGRLDDRARDFGKVRARPRREDLRIAIDEALAVTWGEQTTDEMCLAFLSFATTTPDDRWTLPSAMAKQLDLFKLAGQIEGKMRQ